MSLITQIRLFYAARDVLTLWLILNILLVP